MKLDSFCFRWPLVSPEGCPDRENRVRTTRMPKDPVSGAAMISSSHGRDSELSSCRPEKLDLHWN
jgi:hypothetical protein